MEGRGGQEGQAVDRDGGYSGRCDDEIVADGVIRLTDKPRSSMLSPWQRSFHLCL